MIYLTLVFNSRDIVLICREECVHCHIHVLVSDVLEIVCLLLCCYMEVALTASVEVFQSAHIGFRVISMYMLQSLLTSTWL